MRHRERSATEDGKESGRASVLTMPVVMYAHDRIRQDLTNTRNAGSVLQPNSEELLAEENTRFPPQQRRSAAFMRCGALGIRFSRGGRSARRIQRDLNHLRPRGD